ncbi:MAG: acetyl-CoA carboxylase carboxyltransferase subunit alpha [Bacteroidetes bacterium]|nr:acetyl-CoA carboxylase carboxyltransferase subunit alpha [Bacteroidota bacterium]MBU2586201.1 acetyl-CoA carboxylase carboxyltransferase subunit alpha [Bacteroidota bacterium]
MAKTILEFEKPIIELESKISEMRKLSETLDINDEIVGLEEKINLLQDQIYANLSRWQIVQLARHPERPYTLDYIEKMSTNFIELHGDRNFRDDKAVVGGFGMLDGETVMFIGQQKGRDTKSNLYRNFGMMNPEGYRKALRLMKLAEKFGKPVITFLDTPGAYPGIEAEERGQAEAIARNLFEMSQLRVPIVVVVIGEGASGGALGIGIGDRVLMLEYCWYSVISPESCSSILWRSWEYKEQAAEALKLTARDLLELKIIDKIVPEPKGGAHRNSDEATMILKRILITEINKLKKIKIEKLIADRIEKFANMGVYSE